jgi:hypothetical protein
MEALLHRHENAQLNQRLTVGEIWKCESKGCVKAKLLVSHSCSDVDLLPVFTCSAFSPTITFVHLTPPPLDARSAGSILNQGAGKEEERRQLAMQALLADQNSKAKKTKGRGLELNVTLASIAHLFSRVSKNADGVRRGELYKRDFWLIFGEPIYLTQQLDVSSPKHEHSHLDFSSHNGL